MGRVKSRVDNGGVGLGCAGAYILRFFHDTEGASVRGKKSGDRASCHPCPDDDYIIHID